MLRNKCNIHLNQRRFMQIKRLELYQKCYRILGVDDSSDKNSVRRAYIELVKKVHPDSGHKDASAERFQDVDKAFKVLQEKFARDRRGIQDDEDEKVFDIKHTAPQHRQYLNFEGYGVGNPFQREKQYQHVKVMKAQQRVLDHRLEKAQVGEKTIMKRGSFYKNHAIKTKYGIDRVVEDLIQEAINKGDFNNLTGTGKPLSSAQSQNPYLDFTTQKLNKILLDNGFTPEWIMLQKEVRDSITTLKDNLTKERSFFGDYPFVDDQELTKWELTIKRYQSDVIQINKNIDKYNLIVPIIQNQFFRIRLETVAETILTDPSVPKSQKRIEQQPSAANTTSQAVYSDLFTLLGRCFSSQL